MKKRILSFMLAICLILPCMIVFSACGPDKDNDNDKLEYRLELVSGYIEESYDNNASTVIIVRVEGKAKSKTLTYSAEDFALRSYNKRYDGYAFGTSTWNGDTREYSIADYESYVMHSLHASSDMYEYDSYMLVVVDGIVDFEDNEIVSLYYKGEKVYEESW